MIEADNIFGNLTQKQLIAADALLAGMTQPEAAKAAGCGVSTIRLWLRDEEFQTYIQTCRKGILTGVVAGLTGATMESLALMLELMRDEETDRRLRASIAKNIAALGRDYTQQFDVISDYIQLREEIDEINARAKAEAKNETS